MEVGIGSIQQVGFAGESRRMGFDFSVGDSMTRPQYHNHPDGWTAVLTPHFIETWRKRTEGRTSLSMMEWVSKVGRKFDQIGDDVPSGGEILNSAFGGPVIAYGYFNRRYNQRRGRWELEMIDVAPPRRFNTKGRSSHGNSHEDTVFMEVNE